MERFRKQMNAIKLYTILWILLLSYITAWCQETKESQMFADNNTPKITETDEFYDLFSDDTDLPTHHSTDSQDQGDKDVIDDQSIYSNKANITGKRHIKKIDTGYSVKSKSLFFTNSDYYQLTEALDIYKEQQKKQKEQQAHRTEDSDLNIEDVLQSLVKKTFDLKHTENINIYLKSIIFIDPKNWVVKLNNHIIKSHSNYDTIHIHTINGKVSLDIRVVEVHKDYIVFTWNNNYLQYIAPELNHSHSDPTTTLDGLAYKNHNGSITISGDKTLLTCKLYINQNFALHDLSIYEGQQESISK